MNKFEALDLDTGAKLPAESLANEVMNKLKNILREKIDPSDPEQASATREMVNMKIRSLQKDFPNWRSFQSIYILSNEPVPQSAIKADFPSPHSVVEFVDSL